ncbi:MAG TPA: molybdopterin-containing oxidoreductase catalytic subunit, partial [Myxococcales bacterium]|nr:molybdopterin-containing oxidoreductase catalytic subunit [Myxococcales bacterium]
NEHGPEAIFHYRNGGSLGLLKQLSDYFFELFGPVTIKHGDICSGASEAAQTLDFGLSDSNDLHDLYNAKHIILWGKNVATSSPHTLRVIKQARERGAQVVLIDPIHHQSVRWSDRYIQPRPGSDFALAMAVGRVLFEQKWHCPDASNYCDNWHEFSALVHSRSVADWCAEADLDPEVAHDLAQRLGPGKPTTILVGWGMGRRLNGAAITRALDALGAITGNLGIAGGGVSFYFRRRDAFEAPFIKGAEAAPRSICEPLFGPELLKADPPVRATWITAGNPVVMLPESETSVRALEQQDFVVVVDSFLTDTAKLADLVLPTTTLLEDDDLFGAYGHHYLSTSQPVVAPPPGVRSDLEIMQGLAARVGLAKEMAGSAQDWKARFIGPRLKSHNISLNDLDQGPVRNPMAPKILFEDRQFSTPSGRVNLITHAPNDPPAAPTDYPFQMLSVSTPKAQSSQWTQVPETTVATVNPDALAGFKNGQRCLLESEIGAIEVVLHFDPNQRHDVVIVPKGGHRDKGQCPNVLIQARTSDLGGGGALYDQQVRIVEL